MFRTILCAAGIGAGFAATASATSGRVRLLSGAGAVVTLAYAGWTTVFGSVMTELARGVGLPAQPRQPGP